jgi:hypothetical protein
VPICYHTKHDCDGKGCSLYADYCPASSPQPQPELQPLVIEPFELDPKTLAILWGMK